MDDILLIFGEKANEVYLIHGVLSTVKTHMKQSQIDSDCG